MKFRFCGDADCPDWVLAEINTLSRLSSVKLKLLAQVVTQGILNPPINIEKAEKLFVETKLDTSVDLKACIACLTFIITSATRFGCDQSALHSELQQLGLPREHSTSIKRVVDENANDLAVKFKAASLRVNALQDVKASVDPNTGCAILNLEVNNEKRNLTLTPFTLDVMLQDLKEVRNTMQQLFQ